MLAEKSKVEALDSNNKFYIRYRNDSGRYLLLSNTYKKIELVYKKIELGFTCIFSLFNI